jgi:hypothetical protein
MLELVKSLLPEGWTAEESKTYGIVMHNPHAGYVTIDLAMRGFTAGCCIVRKRGPYKGRGWQRALVEAAVACLKESEEFWKNPKFQR